MADQLWVTHPKDERELLRAHPFHKVASREILDNGGVALVLSEMSVAEKLNRKLRIVASRAVAIEWYKMVREKQRKAQ